MLLVLAITANNGGVVSAQTKGPEKSSTASPARSNNEQEVIARLFGLVTELKSEPNRIDAALLQSEIADIIWQFDEPASRATFRLAFDTARESPTPSSSLVDVTSQKERLKQSRRRISAIKAILKRYGAHDRKEPEAWMREFEKEIEANRSSSRSNWRMSQAEAELLAELALTLISENPKEAQRLGSLVLAAEGNVPMAFYQLLLDLRDRDKVLSDVLWRQVFSAMRAKSFDYDSVLIPLTNYAFFSNGRRFPDTAPADVALVVQYFVDAAAAQAARSRSGLNGTSTDQTSRESLYVFLTSRALPIVTLNSPENFVLLRAHIDDLAQGLTAAGRQQADLATSLMSDKQMLTDAADVDIEARIDEAMHINNSATRNLMLRNLVLGIMRSDPEKALSVTKKIDNAEIRAQTEDDVYVVMLQKAFRERAIDRMKTVALKLNDNISKAKWLAATAGQLAVKADDTSEATDLLSQSYSIAMKSDNTPAKLEVLLLIAKDFARFDKDRGFAILAEAVDTANRLDPKAESKRRSPPGTTFKIISITVINGTEVSTDDSPTLESMDFHQISSFAEHDYVRTSALGTNIKDRLLRGKYFIALARTVLHVPRRGPAYERSLQDIISR